jgi:hypothetical protein
MPEVDLSLLKQQLERIEAAVGASSLPPLAPGGSGPHDPGMEARVAKVEAAVEHIQVDTRDIKMDLREIRQDARTDFRLQFGALIAVALGLAGLMAKGFHWIGG